MELIVAVVLLAGVLAFVIGIRQRDLPPLEPVSPIAHLEEKKTRIYEGLRDLQFEYRVGKLSDDDYQRTKTELQKELAVVMADIESSGAAPAKAPETPAAPTRVCPHCRARFDKAMKFCGECGKPMEAGA